ncbi:Spo0E family sporulation regulatory protein-aspartic acid phosphatase [Wukongibacter sp. M2B1]|uniref:Spo0E family sporulation regulatory protein-aspartic acid phosphatase n=1 Tax=Wukongibacter sp. M2B1 TaxID=3088895 RepID=UPI003D7A0FDE
MNKPKSSQEDIKKKMEGLRLALNKIYEENGNTEEVVRISQELDYYIVMEQKRKLQVKE